MFTPTDHQKKIMRQFIALKREQKDLDARVSEIQARIVKWLKDSDTSSIEVNGYVTLTVVTGKTHSYDMDALKKVDPSTFALVTKTVVDTSSFNAALKAELIPAGIRTSKDNKSHLRVS